MKGMKIQINLDAAEQIATDMTNASDSIQQAISGSIVKATRTTVAVNSKAQTANEEAIKLVHIFNQCFLETINNIQSVAKEFERTDEELHHSLGGFQSISEMFQDLNTYNKAKNG